MPSYKIIDHTGDMGFELAGKTLPEVYARSLLALSDIIVRSDALSASEARELVVSGEDDVSRLHAILEEALFQFEKDGFLAKEAKVSVSKDGSVLAKLKGQRVDPATQPVDRVVKAITWHGLAIEKKRGKVKARVILDL